MSNIASLLIDLLCHISFEPEGGHSEDARDDLQIDTWQALLHELSDEDAQLIKLAAQQKIAQLEKLANEGGVSSDQADAHLMLSAFVNGEMI